MTLTWKVFVVPFMYVHLVCTIIPTSLEGHMIHWTRPIHYFLMEPLFASSSGCLHCWLLGLVVLGLFWVWVFSVLLLLALAEVGPVLSSLLFWCCFEVFDGVSFFSLVICVFCLFFLPFPILPTIPLLPSCPCVPLGLCLVSVPAPFVFPQPLQHPPHPLAR